MNLLRNPRRACAFASAGLALTVGACTMAHSHQPASSSQSAFVDGDGASPTPSPSSALANTEIESLFASLTALYEPEAKARGNSFAIVRSTDPASQARAAPGSEWKVLVTQTLLNEAGLTRDALAVIVCHEIGHLIGGFPFHGDLQDTPPPAHTVVAVEEQADYFAGKECLRRLWSEDTQENLRAAEALDAGTRAQCDAAWPSADARAVCYRIARAAEHDFGGWLAARHPDDPRPQLSTPEASVASTTFDSYGSLQCRIDTIFHGALCPVSQAAGVVPGLGAQGEWIPNAESESNKYNCTTGPGARPSCWYVPNAPEFECKGIPAKGICTTDESGQSVQLTCDHRYGQLATVCPADTPCVEIEGAAYCGDPRE